MSIRPLLFDMKNYDQESYDQITHYPNKAEELKLKLEEFEKVLKENTRGWLK
jgi:hypothetical protein